MLSASTNLANPEYADEFNSDFINALRTKHNYIVWSCGVHTKFVDISPKYFKNF